MDRIWMWIACNEEMRLSEMLPLDEIIADLAQYFRNKNKPIEEWEFSQEEMESYIFFFDNEEYVKKAGEEKLALARRFIDTLCAQENALALRIMGYACYGGSRLYPCDWNTSRDCVTRLFEMKDDPQYANTLGYIYYYGRCNGGVPEYDKAFYYFGIAAANGLYEGMYKLADMLWHGYGCRKSQKTSSENSSGRYDTSHDGQDQGNTVQYHAGRCPGKCFPGSFCRQRRNRDRSAEQRC